MSAYRKGEYIRLADSIRQSHRAQIWRRLGGKKLTDTESGKKLDVWTERISACRNSGQGVKSWCRENHICEATYYKWQRKVFELIQTQQVRFAEITPQPQPGGNIAVTVRVAGAEAEIYSGADHPISRLPILWRFRGYAKQYRKI